MGNVFKFSMCYAKPKYETWFMEGKLIKDFHCIEVEDAPLTKRKILLYEKY